MCINSFNSHNSLHYTDDKTEEIKKLNNSPKVTQLVVDEVQIWTQADWIWNLKS